MISFSELNSIALEYKEALIERAEDANMAIRAVQNKFLELGVDDNLWVNFSEDTGQGYDVEYSIGWVDKKICYRVEDHDPEVLLGASAELRVAYAKDLQKLIDKAVDKYVSKINELALEADAELTESDEYYYDPYAEPLNGGPSEADIMLSNGWDRG